jgi:hypothetical protein
MNTNVSFFRPLVLAALATIATSSAASAAWPADHLNQAFDWNDPLIEMANNAYGTPASIWIDGSNKVHAVAKCGSFTALLLKAAYPVITNDVLTALTGSNSPTAGEWYTAISNEASDTTRFEASGIAFHKRAVMADIEAGDILASAYTMSGDTGHVMTIRSITLKTTNATLPSGKTITGVGLVNKYEVTVYDATNSPHGSYSSNPAPDTRYRQVNSVWTKDEGVGYGTIVIYEEVSTGRIVAWAWNVSPTTDSYYYAVTPNPGTWGYRPLVAGFLDGPGL